MPPPWNVGGNNHLMTWKLGPYFSSPSLVLQQTCLCMKKHYPKVSITIPFYHFPCNTLQTHLYWNGVQTSYLAPQLAHWPLHTVVFIPCTATYVTTLCISKHFLIRAILSCTFCILRHRVTGQHSVQHATSCQHVKKAWEVSNFRGKNVLLSMFFLFFRAFYSFCSKDSKNSIKIKKRPIFFSRTLSGTSYLQGFLTNWQWNKWPMSVEFYNIWVCHQDVIDISTICATKGQFCSLVGPILTTRHHSPLWWDSTTFILLDQDVFSDHWDSLGTNAQPSNVDFFHHISFFAKKIVILNDKDQEWTM